MIRTLTIVYFFLFSGYHAFSQQFMLQGWYWDYPKTAEGHIWADTLDLKLALLKDAGFTHVWMPPHTTTSSGLYSNGYDPRDLYVGNATTGFGPRARLDNLLDHMILEDISPVADMVMNHRDGGLAEYNPAVENYIENFSWNQANNNDNPYPSDRFRCILPLGGTSLNGAGDYYFKLSSASQHSRFHNKPYTIYMQTKVKGWQSLPDIQESEPNGGGSCSETNNQTFLGQNFLGNVDGLGCTVDELHLYLDAADFLASGDTLEIYLTNRNSDYSDHRFYEIWSASRAQNIVNEIIYQTYTDFTNMPSGLGFMNYECFKPNSTNITGLQGDQDWMWFYYDYDQNSDCARDALFDWALWTCQEMGVKGFRLDAVKHFPANFVGDMLDHLFQNGVTLDLIVGEWYGTSVGELSGWVNNVLNSMDQATRDAMSPKIFDFSLREQMRRACDDFGTDARDMFSGSLADNGLSGFHVVTFVNNHDFRDENGFASLVKNDPILPYAYILTNNKLGVPCVFYPDYFGYQGEAQDRNSPDPLKPQIDQLIEAHNTYIYGKPNHIYLSQNGSGYNNTYTTGFPSTTLTYQMYDAPSGNNVIVAINFAGEPLDVTQNINTGVINSIDFTDILGNSLGPDTIQVVNNALQLRLPARSYSVWVEGLQPQIPLDINFISFDAVKDGKEVRLSGQLALTEPLEKLEIERSFDGKSFDVLDQSVLTEINQILNVNYTDRKPGSDNFYRLKAVSKTGLIKYSQIRKVSFEPSASRLKNTLVSDRLEFENVTGQSFSANIYNLKGDLIRQIKNQNDGIDVSDLVSGAYIIEILSGNEVVKQRFVKQ